jgi:hypothetical protein
MHKMLTFTFGVLMGMVVATAWANYSKYPTADSPPKGEASMSPIAMMTHAHPPVAPHYDAH